MEAYTLFSRFLWLILPETYQATQISCFYGLFQLFLWIIYRFLTDIGILSQIRTQWWSIFKFDGQIGNIDISSVYGPIGLILVLNEPQRIHLPDTFWIIRLSSFLVTQSYVKVDWTRNVNISLKWSIFGSNEGYMYLRYMVYSSVNMIYVAISVVIISSWGPFEEI